MFKVLDQIDTAFIFCAQWVIRQIELFTSYTRNDIGDIMLRIEKYYLIPAFAVVLLFKIDEIFVFPFLFLSIKFAKPNLSILKKRFEAQKKIQNETLPKEINECKPQRLLGIIANIFFCFVTFKGVQSVVCQLMFLYFISFNLFEYFLCTTSLPPGEKRKREQEKETKNMLPQ